MWSTNKVVVVVVILGNLSKDLYELRTSIRSGLFFLEQYFCPNVWTNRHYNKKEPKKYKFAWSCTIIVPPPWVG